jgi:putative oxidoreductase
MKIVLIIARILLGLIFVFFGGNLVGLSFGHPYLHAPTPPGAAGQFAAGLFVTHFWFLIGLVQVIGGLLLIIGQFVTLGLVILGPVTVCIVYFHSSVAHEGLPLAGLVTILWLIVAWAHRKNLERIFSRTA